MRAPRALALALTAALAGVLPVAPPAAAAPPTCAGVPATIVGTEGADVLEGTKVADVIVALGGDDVVTARSGDDLVCGGNGADTLFGGPGADQLYGGFDRRGEDAGGSYLVGDLLDGGTGDDTLVAVHDGRRVDTRRRPDTFSYEQAESGVVVDLSSSPGTASGQGTDTLRFGKDVGVEGSSFADTLTGSPRRDVLHGLTGDDTLDGADGDDQLFAERVDAGGGDDLLRGGRGSDLLGSYVGRDDLNGGDGDDFVEAYSDRPSVVTTGPGNDYVAQSLSAGSGSGANGGLGRDTLSLYAAPLAGANPRPEVHVDLRTGVLTVSGDPPASGTVGRFEEYRLIGGAVWRFHGTALADRVRAVGGGPLRAWGFRGDDWFHGTGRDDLLNGGDGHDTAVRGGGQDRCLSIDTGC